MSNIMINDNCNQRCSYCFASEFVNIKSNNISFENFIKATNFILTDKDKLHRGQIGIIGGEPLMHPNFDSLMNYLISRDDITKITVFTNGVLIKKHISTLCDNKVRLLINVNSPSDVGMGNYIATKDAIRLLVEEYNKRNKITIGLNIYDNIDYSFFIKMADKYGFQKVRLSIVVPAVGKEKRGLDHFKRLKFKVLDIAKALLIRDIRFKFDCNLPVHCIWEKNELEDMRLMGLCGEGRDLIPLGYNFCSPVIDILPDLTAIRCFGLSDITKVAINEFSTINELIKYYINKFDTKIARIPIDNKCLGCNLFPMKCFGGCLANRLK